ncbi:MAG: DUF2058 domain-containing protein [Gammaproteobacteria bacterium]|nr:DUF2058 domain-containing protein [Gammaproteobacteria bacterium]
MANPFQDQLLKAGLVSKDKVNKVNKSKHKKNKQRPKDQITEEEERKHQIKQAAQEKAERDRELNRLKHEEENKRAIMAQIRQLVEMNCVSSEDGEQAYNFEHEKKIKTIYVTDELRKQITGGRLAIVQLNGKYELVSKQVAEKIMQRDADFIVVLNDNNNAVEEDDEYAEFKVPDDLMW